METKQKRVVPKSPGRPKGVPNKNTTAIKDMIMQALEGAGGVQYLTTQAKKNPKAFLALLGKVMPLQVQGSGTGGAIVLKLVKGDEEL